MALRKYKFAFFLILFSLILVNLAYSVSIGVSPGSLNFNKMLRDGYMERNVFITFSSEVEMTVNATVRGEIKDWISFEPATKFSVSKDNSKPFKIIAQPPDDIANGIYEGFVRVSTSELGELSGGMGSVTIAAIDLPVMIEIVDEEIIECRAMNFGVRSSEKGMPVEFFLTVINDGNVRLKPRISIDIWDKQQINLVKTIKFNENEILPSSSDAINIEVNTDDLDVGQYWAEITAEECLATDILTFDVMEIGSLTTNGLFEKIANKPWVKIGEIVPITAIFRNIGEKSVLAQFKGFISLNEKVIDVIESENLNVRVSEAVNFTMFFTPKEDGRYIVKGRIFYDNKQTFESTGIINVNSPMEKEGGGFDKAFIYGIMLFIVLVLLFKIRKIRKMQG
jgi:hypothetical protein